MTSFGSASDTRFVRPDVPPLRGTTFATAAAGGTVVNFVPLSATTNGSRIRAWVMASPSLRGAIALGPQR
jgi:hypothetical protein